MPTGALPLMAALRAMSSAKDVFPQAGRAARMIRSLFAGRPEGCRGRRTRWEATEPSFVFVHLVDALEGAVEHVLDRREGLLLEFLRDVEEALLRLVEQAARRWPSSKPSSVMSAAAANIVGASPSFG